MPGMSPRMKIKKGRPLVDWVPGNLPNVTITNFDAAPDIKVPNSVFTATAVDDESGDMEASIQWEIVSAFEIDATAGEQTVDFGGNINDGDDATGLADDATIYVASYGVDGNEAGQSISIVGSAAQTISELISELEADVVGTSWAIVGGNLVVTSDTTGVSSAIIITDGPGPAGVDLFANVTNFVSLSTPVDGADLVPEATVIGGTGGNPTLDFIVEGLQDVVAFVQDGASRGEDTQAVTATDL